MMVRLVGVEDLDDLVGLGRAMCGESDLVEIPLEEGRT